MDAVDVVPEKLELTSLFGAIRTNDPERLPFLVCQEKIWVSGEFLRRVPLQNGSRGATDGVPAARSVRKLQIPLLDNGAILSLGFRGRHQGVVRGQMRCVSKWQRVLELHARGARANV